jgi:hypothetical protein
MKAPKGYNSLGKENLIKLSKFKTKCAKSAPNETLPRTFTSMTREPIMKNINNNAKIKRKKNFTNENNFFIMCG